MKRSKGAAIAGVLTVGVMLAGCTANPDSGNAKSTNESSGSTQGGKSNKSSKVPKQKFNKALHDALPADIKKSGVLKSVNTGSFPPYEIVKSGNKMSGASADMATAIGQILGVKITHTTIDGLGSVLSGMKAHRYDLALGPIGDYKDRQGKAKFVDWVQEHVVFAVPKGNPAHITGLKSTCGTRIAVQAAGSAEQVIKQQSKKCVADGKKKVSVQTYKDQPSSILAVRSNRADGFFSSQAPLTYFVQKSKGQLELAGVGKRNGFPPLYQGATVPTDSPLAKILLKAFKTLHKNGTYSTIMKSWGLENNELKTPGINQGNEV